MPRQPDDHEARGQSCQHQGQHAAQHRQKAPAGNEQAQGDQCPHADSRLIPESSYIAIQQEPLNRFGGATSKQRKFPLQGLWQSGPEISQDRVVLYAVMVIRTDSQFQSLRCLERFKTRLKRKFEQLEIPITVQELLAI